MTSTALLAPDDAARARARAELRQRIADADRECRELGLRPGEWVEGGLPRDLIEHVHQLGTDVGPQELAAVQSVEAYGLVTRDLSRAVRWGWSALDALVGPILPGELWLVGATTGNGKSTFLHNWQAKLARSQRTTLVFPLEVEPSHFRLRTACWQVGVPLEPVVTHDWAALGATEEDARTWLAIALDDLRRDPHLHIAPSRRVTLAELRRWIAWGVEQCGAEVVVVDHVHRFELGATDAGSYRVAMTELARNLRDVARELDIAIVCAVQLNRDADPLDDYQPPGLNRIKEASALAEEATAVLMLSRDIDPQVEAADVRAVKQRRALPSAIERRGCMVLCCRKHRRRGSARHQAIRLHVDGNERITDWPTIPRVLGRDIA